MEKKKLLFVCTANQDRSKTAEEMYRNDPRYEVRSCGTSVCANVQVSRQLIEWADIIAVMRPEHSLMINNLFPGSLEGKDVRVLNVEDYYDYMHPRLMEKIKEAMIKAGLDY